MDIAAWACFSKGAYEELVEWQPDFKESSCYSTWTPFRATGEGQGSTTFEASDQPVPRTSSDFRGNLSYI